MRKKIGQMLDLFSLKYWLGIGISFQGVGGVTIPGTVPEASEWGIGDVVFRGLWWCCIDGWTRCPWRFPPTLIILWYCEQMGVFFRRKVRNLFLLLEVPIPHQALLVHFTIPLKGLQDSQEIKVMQPFFYFPFVLLSLCGTSCVILMQEYYYIFAFTSGLLWGFILP